MRRISPALRHVLAVLAILGLLAAGCGDDDETASTGTTTSPTSEANPPDDGTTAPEAAEELEVYLLVDGDECDAVEAVQRPSTTEGALPEALEQLLAGPTAAEEADGLTSWFSEDTEGMLLAVEVTDGVAQVSFDGDLPTTIPNASTSCGSAGLLAQLDATVEQFDDVDRAVYSLDGDVDAFYEWLQLTGPDA